MFTACFDAGLMVRVTGDTIALSPPLIISEKEIDFIFTKLGEVIEATP